MGKQNIAKHWKARRTNVSVRCDPARGGCGTVHPGRYMVEVDPVSGLCLACREKGVKGHSNGTCPTHGLNGGIND